MSVMVHSVHNNIVPHIATPSCLFRCEFLPWLTMLFLAWLSRTVNKDKQNIWRDACALYHAFCKV